VIYKITNKIHQST